MKLANDNALPRTGLAFPADAVAHIFRPCRSAMTSAPRLHEEWRLVFQRRTAPFVEPLMGWTGGADTLAQVDLTFPTLEAAVDYACRQGLRYVVHHDARSRRSAEKHARHRRAFSDVTLGRLGLGDLRSTYDKAMSQADASTQGGDPGTEHFAIDVARDVTLTLDEKRSILMNRAFDEFLFYQRTPEAADAQWSRLKEIEQALVTLEHDAATSVEQMAGAA